MKGARARVFVGVGVRPSARSIDVSAAGHHALGGGGVHRFGGDLGMTGFERLMSAHSAVLELRVHRAGSPGKQVMIVAPEGEIDGVEHGTHGVFEGVLEDLNGRVLAAVRLDDNGEMVYVDPKACVLALT